MGRVSENGMAVVYNNTLPVLRDGQGGGIAADSSGRIILSPTSGAGALGTPVVSRAAAILTNGYVAGSAIDVSAYDQIVIYAEFTKGSLTDLDIKVEFSPDNTIWVQETFASILGDTSTETLGIHTYSATGNYRLPVEVADKYVRISAIGNGTVTSSSLALTVIGK